MAELNFGLLTPPGSQSIGNAFVSGMDQAQEARARDLQMQQSVRKGQMDELQYKKAQDAEAKLNQFYAHVAENGGPKNPEEIEAQMIGSGVPHVIETGLAARSKRLQLAQERATFANIMGGGAPNPAPTPAAMSPTVAPEPGAFGANVADRKAEMSDWAQPNTLAPSAAPTAGASNALAGAADVSALRQKRNALLAMGTPQSIAAARALDADIALAARPPVYHNVPGRGLVDPSTGKVIVSSVEPTNDLIKQYEYAQGQGFKGTLLDYRKSIAEAGRSPGTTVNVDTKVGNKYGEKFASEVGDADVKLRNAALDAPTMAANANQTLKLLEDPKIFTGGAAQIKLELARALNVIGETDATSIANTEKLIQSTGRATLDSIKTSGLGTGQGFTDKDLKMLQGVAGGTITLNADTLRSFATAQHNAAQAIVKKWESRRTNIPTAALSGTGIDKETYTLEPKYSPYVETKTAPDGRRLGKKADGTVEVIK